MWSAICGDIHIARAPLMFECIASSSVNICLTNKTTITCVEISVCCLITHYPGYLTCAMVLIFFEVPCDEYCSIEIPWYLKLTILWYKLDWLIGWLIDWLIGWLVGWLVGWLIDWLIDWLVGWLIDWLIDWWKEADSKTRNQQVLVAKVTLYNNNI